MTIDEEIDNRYADVLLRTAIPNGECLECQRTPASTKYCRIAGNEDAHRFIFRVKKGPIGTSWVLHSCDNMRCINPEHLFLGTQQDNAADCYAKGRWTNTGRPQALSDEECVQIKQLRASGVSANELALKFFVSVRLVYQVLAGEGRHASPLR